LNLQRKFLIYTIRCAHSRNNFLYDYFPFIKINLVIELAKREYYPPTHYLKHYDLQNLIQQSKLLTKEYFLLSFDSKQSLNQRIKCLSLVLGFPHPSVAISDFLNQY
jgi:hypothetical protein